MIELSQHDVHIDEHNGEPDGEVGGVAPDCARGNFTKTIGHKKHRLDPIIKARGKRLRAFTNHLCNIVHVHHVKVRQKCQNLGEL